MARYDVADVSQGWKKEFSYRNPHNCGSVDGYNSSYFVENITTFVEKLYWDVQVLVPYSAQESIQ